jgi:hypothetical protein
MSEVWSWFLIRMHSHCWWCGFGRFKTLSKDLLCSSPLFKAWVRAVQDDRVSIVGLDFEHHVILFQFIPVSNLVVCIIRPFVVFVARRAPPYRQCFDEVFRYICFHCMLSFGNDVCVPEVGFDGFRRCCLVELCNENSVDVFLANTLVRCVVDWI